MTDPARAPSPALSPTHDRRLDVPLAAYIHLPWCVHKCPYCDFNSHRAPDNLPETAYIDALISDWALASRDEVRSIESIYIGGGTPSLFSGASIERLLTAIDDTLGLANGCEITMEVNPGTNKRGAFADWRAAGVNRVSLGLQSLNNAHLAQLGRIHDAAAARSAVTDARSAGFQRINCDLMFGLPDQTIDEAAADLDAVLALAPSHVSYYQLTFEPGTPFYKQPPARIDDDGLAAMADAGAERLTEAGLHRYEISAFAETDAFCRHNDHVWRFGDYLGIGAGAHGKQTCADGRIERTARLRWPTGYQAAAGSTRAVAESRWLAADDAWFECLLGGLRRPAGIARADFEPHTGLSWENLLTTCQRQIEQGLLTASDERLTTTPVGWRYLDSILAELVPSES
ncbi:radical SAM family heme chaperone HemW [Salinisphaera orenii]|uniref:radical SAM family heme chaperone HemW n=1 Tax=Salinisphaera orenii TaxID=856731 RepID=UPI000DBE099F